MLQQAGVEALAALQCAASASPATYVSMPFLLAVFVFCGDQEKCKGEYKQCWLKHLVSPAHVYCCSPLHSVHLEAG
jgi:hypothetical protein